MALGTTPFSNATVVATIPEVWTPMILEELFAKTCGANFFTDLSPYATNGGDILHVPDLFTNTFPVQTQTTQGTEVTLSAPAQVDVTLTINTHRYIAFQVGDLTLQQIAKDPSLGYSISKLYTTKVASGLKNALEAALFALWSGLTTNSIGDTATVLSDAEIRRSINALASANFDLSECAWFFHPFVYWVQLAAIAKYYDKSQSGMGLIQNGNFGPMDATRGLIGNLYGIPTFTTTNVVSGLQTYRNLLAHKTAFGFATQTPGGSPVRVQSENKIEFLSNVTVADMIYGVVELRDAAAVVVNANNAFIGS